MKEALSFDRARNLHSLRKRLVKSFMDLMILSKLKEKPLSGYDVIKMTYRRFHILLGSGSVYTLLYSLEREGLIKGTWTERRRLYRLTRKGQVAIEAILDFYKKIEEFMKMHVIS